MADALSKVYSLVQPIFRRNRQRWFFAKIQPGPNDKILDLGGSPWFWHEALDLRNITILNIARIDGNFENRFHVEQGDATSMRYRDFEFDIVHSNSVIEHVGDYVRQKKFADEARRTGRKLWIQSPAKCFFIEPHFIGFACHWLPRPICRRIVRYLSVWGISKKPSQDEIDFFLDGIRLLTRREMQALFPDCCILTERFLGWPKSYIAVRMNAGFRDYAAEDRSNSENPVL